LEASIILSIKILSIKKCGGGGGTLVPAAFRTHELTAKIMLATQDTENEWFFFDGAFNSSKLEANSVNTWLYENFVAIYNNEVFAYFESA
jgi:hypothetical protein